MDDIHVYLPSGMRVVISEPASSYERLLSALIGELQVRKWYGWKTVQQFGYSGVDITELETQVDGIVCDLLAEYEKKLARQRAVKSANARLQAIFHGKVRDVKCPPKEATAGE